MNDRLEKIESEDSVVKQFDPVFYKEIDMFIVIIDVIFFHKNKPKFL